MNLILATLTLSGFLILILMIVFLMAGLGYTAKVGYEEFGKREQRIKKALTYLKKNKEITNSQYEKLNKVSDATATRDLDMLERKGFIKQFGKIGRGVKYKLVNTRK